MSCFADSVFGDYPIRVTTIKIYLPFGGYYDVLPSKNLIENFISYNFGDNKYYTYVVRQSHAATEILKKIAHHSKVMVLPQGSILMVEIDIRQNSVFAQKLYEKLVSVYHDKLQYGKWTIQSSISYC